jgi:O-antigen ligase
VLHSFYLTTLVEIGLKGLLVEIAFLGVLFWKTMRLPAATSASGDLSLMQRAFFLSMLAMALSSVFDSPLMTAPFMYLYFGFAGILWHGNQWSA